LNLGQFLSKKFCSNFEGSLLRVNLKLKSNFGISKFPKVLGIKQKKNYQFSLILKKVMAKRKSGANLPHPVYG